MQRKLVKILGIEHHELVDSVARANLSRGVISSDAKPFSMKYHTNELALYIPEFRPNLDVSNSGYVTLQRDSSLFGFRNPIFSKDDVYLIQLVPKRLTEESFIFEGPKYRIILARLGEFKAITDPFPSDLKSVSNLTVDEEAAIYLSNYCYTYCQNPGSRFDTLSYKRDSFTQEEIKERISSLPQPESSGLKYTVSGMNKPNFPGERYDKLTHKHG